MTKIALQWLRPVWLIAIAIVGFLAFQFAGSTAFGQSGATGTLTGVVMDPNGANLPGVSVRVRNNNTGASRTVTTDAEGRWTMPGLPVGSYQVLLELSGFKTSMHERIDVEASVPRSLEDKMEIGEVGAVVNITEGAALVTPDTATTFRQLSAEDLVAVPTSTRSFTQLLSTEAGVNT
ncbi:MAG: carboxypeptidase-like regulatory domain-containing protein, partial [Pyrinomonadaceae bacterium]